MSGNLVPSAFLGLVSRKPRWGLTFRGWLALLASLLVLAVLLVLGIQPFLAVSRPVPSQVMVVEGWIPLTALRTAADRFRQEGYTTLYCIGEPLPDDSGAPSGANYGQITANQFYEMGLPPGSVEVVPSGHPQRDRTYTGAVALREWINGKGTPVASFNVVTKGVHSRRSRLMFEAAFGEQMAVGVISLPDLEYDPARWWRYSEGVKEIISEAGAYLYARLLFRAAD